MARRFTMQALEDRIRELTETVNDDNVTTAFIRSQLSTVYGQLWGTVVETGMRYFETRANLVSGALPGEANALAEPADIFLVVRLDYVKPDGWLCPVRELMAQELDRVTSPTTGEYASFYELVDDRFLLYRTPPAGQTYRLLYVPQPPDLAGFESVDLVDVVTPDGEAFLTYAVAAIVKEKRQQESLFWEKQADKGLIRLSKWAQLRSLHQPRRPVVRDDYGEDDYPREGDFR